MTDAGPRPVDVRRHRRRPGDRDAVPRDPPAVRGGPRHRRDRAHRRDRRHGRGGGRGVGRRAPARRPEGRVHRRPHRARGQADGPRRRDRLGRAGHGGVQGRGARGGRVPRRRLPHGAARRSCATPATAASCASTTSATCSPTTAGRPGGCWRSSTALPAEVWGATGVVGDRGLGAILVHQLGAHMRWRLGLGGDDEAASAARPEREPLPSPTRSPAAGPTSGTRPTRGSTASTDAWLERARRGRAVLADARPRREPRDPAPVGGGGAADRGRARSPGDLDMIFFAEELALTAG